MKTYSEPIDILQRIQEIASQYWPNTQPIMGGTIIKEFLISAGICDYVWLIINVAIEIDFRINIPDEIGTNVNQTFSEFSTMLSMVEPIQENSTWTFNRIKLITDTSMPEGYFTQPYF